MEKVSMIVHVHIFTHIPVHFIIHVAYLYMFYIRALGLYWSYDSINRVIQQLIDILCNFRWCNCKTKSKHLFVPDLNEYGNSRKLGSNIFNVSQCLSVNPSCFSSPSPERDQWHHLEWHWWPESFQDSWPQGHREDVFSLPETAGLDLSAGGKHFSGIWFHDFSLCIFDLASENLKGHPLSCILFELL